MKSNSVQDVIASVLDVFSGRKPLALLDHLVAQNLVCYMDRVQLNLRREGLRAWFKYMHATMRRRQIVVDVNIGRIEEVSSRRYKVSGTAVTKHENGGVASRRFSVDYLIESGRITGVWSTRTNYVGVVGRSVLFPMYLGFIYHCVRAWSHGVSATWRGRVIGWPTGRQADDVSGRDDETRRYRVERNVSSIHNNSSVKRD